MMLFFFFFDAIRCRDVAAAARYAVHEYTSVFMLIADAPLRQHDATAPYAIFRHFSFDTPLPDAAGR